jgi:hypothetical protein
MSSHKKTASLQIGTRLLLSLTNAWKGGNAKAKLQSLDAGYLFAGSFSVIRQELR